METHSPVKEMPPYMRVADVKENFGIPDRALWKMLASQEVAGSKRGKLWFVETASVFKFLKKYKNVHKED